MNLNKVLLIGNLTRDPESKTLPNGRPISNFSIATNRTWTNQETGEKQKQAEFHNIVAFGKLADICNQYLTKGKLVYLEGRLQTRSWEDQNGTKRYRTEIILENMQMGPKFGAGAGEYPATLESKEKLPVEDIGEETEPTDKKGKEKKPSKKTKDSADGEEEIDVNDIPF